MDNIFWTIAAILWTACGVVTIGASVVAHRSSRARYIGRAAVGVLFVIGGALVHVINLAAGGDYTTFADPAHFDWVTNTWRDVVGPNQVLFIGLLAAFEAAVGVLAVSGRRRTQLGYAGVVAFYLALWLFGWFETVWVIVMIPPMLLLLRAERRAPTGFAPDVTVGQKPRAHVGS
ncbi:MAG TPA: hypothetical protein VFJ22_05685 [Dermatophilaceae bacterium]|nr:hypothetical protein [Dermatophilaceae bacterium]